MAVVTGSNSGFGNIDTPSILGLFYSTIIGTSTSNAWSSGGLSGAYQGAQWDMVGTDFGTVQNGYPTTGIVTSINYMLNSVIQMSVTGLTLDMARFRQLQVAGDFPSYQEFAALLFASGDTFNGGAGNDSFDGYGGNDLLTGGAGNDFLIGGEGNDELFGGDGTDDLSDGELNSQVPNSGNDTFDGGVGNDRISATSGNDTLNGGDGDDYLLIAGLGIVTIDGGAGFDRVSFDRANSTVALNIDLSGIASGGSMQLADGTVIRNVEVISELRMGSGNDVVRLGLDNIRLTPSVTFPLSTIYNLNIDLGNGIDRIIADFTASDYTITLENSIITRINTAGTHSNNIRVLAEEIEIRTGSGNDILHASRAFLSCVFDGGAGDDHLEGGYGADVLIGGDGNDGIVINYGGVDTVDGGAGYDFLVMSLELSSVPISLAPMAMANANGWTAFTGAQIRNVESVDARLSNYNDTVSLSHVSLITGRQLIDAYYGYDKLVADFSLVSTSIRLSYGSSGSSGSVSTNNISVFLNSFEQFEILSGGGNDFLNGSAGNDAINGGLGNDQITGGGGVDQLFGGGGDDVITSLSEGLVASGLIDGGAGVDYLNLTISQPNDGFSLSTSQLASSTGATIGSGIIKNMESFAIYANAKTGILTIDSQLVGKNVFDSQSQFSILFVEASDATTKVSLGENGNTFSIAGGNGDLTYRNVVLSVVSGSAADILIGGFAGDRMNGGAGNDFLNGLYGNDLLIGGLGDDVLIGGSDGDTLNGGEGTDTASYANSYFAIYVFAGDGGSWTGDATGDVYNSIENLTGSNFNDILGMDGGNNTIDGGGGDDVLYGQGGGDVLIGGAGFDTASYATATSGIYAFVGDWGSFTGDARGDFYNSIEAVIGTNFNDVLGMDDCANRLIGGAGNDVLYGEGGGDQLFGNAGFDTVSYALAPSGVYVFLTDLGNATGDAAGDSFFSEIESIVGTNFDDVIGMGNFNDLLVGGGGNDILHGLGGGDRFFGNDGFDTVSYALAGSGVYVFLRDLGNATGDAAGDGDFSSIESIVGSNFNDVIGMGDFGDTIIAGGGNDIVFGLGGNDALWGGSGSDLFAYNGVGFGQDTIRDFQDGTDRIDFSRMAGVNYASLGITSVAGGVQVALGTDTILLSGVAIGQVSAADFLFA